MAKKLKDMVKKNPVANPTFGRDPWDPWATKYNVTEASETELLARYLNSRGINPRFVTKDTKISHAKSAEYAKWKADHIERFAREETEQLDELSPGTMASYILKTSGKDPKRAEPRKKIMSKLAKVMAKRPVDPHAPRFSTNIVGEGFDDYKGIAKELVKRHGKNVTKQHIKDIEGERDTRNPLDHDEIMAHVKKLNEAKKLTSLDKFRKSAAEREKKHAEIEKQSKEKPDMKGAIDRLEKHLNKEAADAGISKAKETSFHKKLDKLVHSTFGKRKDEMKMKEEVELDEGISDFDRKEKSRLFKAKLSAASKSEPHVDKLLARTGMNMAHKFPRKGQTNMSNIPGINTPNASQSTKEYGEKSRARRAKELKPAIKAALGTHGPKGKLPEEVEQIDELNYDTVKSLYKKRRDDFHGDQVGKKKKGKEVSAKNVSRSISRLMGSKPTQKEDAFQDTYAATQMPFDGANTTNDTSMKREMSKSARIIKSIYKRKNMKEELADWEKEDKSVQSYGKKPKLAMTDKKSNIGENKPEARAVMTGGKTLTGQDRDMVEIDPAMKNRPDKPDTFDKGNPKKSPA